MGRPMTECLVPGPEQAIRRARMTIAPILLCAPLLVFLIVFFFAPLAVMLSYSVRNSEVPIVLPNLSKAIATWDGLGLPPASVFSALALDLKSNSDSMALGEAARRLDFEVPGYRALVFKTARRLQADQASTSGRDELTRIDARWANPRYWSALNRATASLTPAFFLAAFDLKMDDLGHITRVEEDRRVYLDTFLRTFQIGGTVTLLCLLLGYPIAFAITVLPRRFAAALTFSVILPFWTSLLVRTSAWIVVLSKDGVVNSFLTRLGVINEPLQLIFNRTGLYIVMVHILLPFMVLPIRSVMQGISPNYMKASASLGAHPFLGFFKVYLPLTLPGVGAGCLMTFIIAIGYYITPALVGGAGDNMISFFIAFHTNSVINWGMAAALGVVLLSAVLLIFGTFGRLLGLSRIVALK
ncbi:ABC transporter permease [Mesorhizobium intechi]|nr:ABC transporter permease [Mesorhizobium intechi]